MKKVVLDFNGLDSKEEIQEYLAEKMKFPFYYGRNLDALYDCLTDICEPVAIVLNMPNSREDNHLEFYLDKLYRTWENGFRPEGELQLPAELFYARCSWLEQCNPMFFAGFSHLFWPDAGLNFSYMGAV